MRVAEASSNRELTITSLLHRKLLVIQTVLLLFFQLATATPGAPPSRFELPNGLRVWIQEDHRRPVALAQVTYTVGSLDEVSGQTGVAHYVEHMVYRATEHIRNEDVYGYIDRIGGRYTGGTWPEVTKYAETVPSWAIESALRVTAERMCCALFDSTEFERERHNVVTEANGFSDVDPLNAMRDAVMYSAFEAHPYRLNSNTWARDNLVLTRDEAFAWYKRHYGPNNAVLAIVGDVDAASVRAMVERLFADIPRAPERGRITVVEPPQRAEKRVIVTSPGVRPELHIVYHAPAARHPDFAALAVTSRLIAQYLPEALNRTGVHGDVAVTDSASQYPYVLRIVVNPDSARDLDRALAVVDSVIARLLAGRMSDDQLRAARVAASPRDSVPTSTAAGGIVPPRRSYLTRLADELTDRESQPWELSRAAIDSARDAARRVTARDVAAFASRWLRPLQRTVGVLRPGPNDFVATWTDERRLAGERMEIPPLTTPPARRELPEPVPARALQPLAPIDVPTARRELRNGIAIRAAHVRDAALPFVRIDCDCPDTTRSAAIARPIRADTSALLRGARIFVVPVGTRADSSPEGIARHRALHVVAPSIDADAGIALVSVVTAGDPARTTERVARVLAGIPAVSRSSGTVAAASTSQGGEERIALASATQVAVVASLPGVPRHHADRRALELLSYIVGVPSYGGRLGWALTKSGLTYAAAATNSFGATTGAILLSTECDTRNTDSVIQAIREVVEGVAASGVTEWELREAQAFMLGRTLLYGARVDSDEDVIAAALNRSEESGVEQLDLPALSKAYLAVTLADVNRVARAYYRPELLHVVAAGALPVAQPAIFPAGTFRALFSP